jgi:hypothetical protein
MTPEASEFMGFAPESGARGRRSAPAPFWDKKGTQASEKIGSRTKLHPLAPNYPVTSSASRPVSVRPYSSTASTTTR